MTAPEKTCGTYDWRETSGRIVYDMEWVLDLRPRSPQRGCLVIVSRPYWCAEHAPREEEG